MLLATALLLRVPGTAAEWLIGAGAAFFTLDYLYGLDVVIYRDVYKEDVVHWGGSMAWRSAGALAILLAVILAWPRAAQPGPPIRRLPAAILVVGCAVALLGVSQAFKGYFDKPNYDLLALAATAALLLVLLFRVFRRRDRTSATAALVAAGLTGTGVGLITMIRHARRDAADPAADVWAMVGFLIILAVGLWAWFRLARRSAD